MVTGSNQGLEYELGEAFSFSVPGAKWMPAFKSGIWDGRIKLYNYKTKLIYRGLLPRVLAWAEKNNYQIEIDDSLQKKSVSLNDQECQAFIGNLNLPITPRHYQISSFRNAIDNKRLTILSPTASGKSLIIYMITRYLNNKVLLIVPTVNLIHQMADDFKSYGYKEDCHLIFSGQDKLTKEKITISTWQSIFRMPRLWFDQFDTVIVDEVHQAKAKSLTNILEKMTKTEYRYGTTGTLDGSETNRLVIEGLIGPVDQQVTTTDLIQEEYLADFNVKCLVIRYSEDLVQANKGNGYQEEIDLIIGNEQRNQLIFDLVNKVPGNNLVLFNFIEKHGHKLKELFEANSTRPVYYIDGKTDPKIRNEMRAQIEKETDCIILASTKVMATGTNIIKLNNIFFTSPSKARITTLQAIGRVLRKSKTKLKATLFDIADDLSYSSKNQKTKYNYTMIHLFERLKIYKQENFPFQIHNIKLKKDKQ
jgi:superfamily II DNA or RNA helicase